LYTVVDHPLAPFTTLAGETKGPCVNVGVPTVHGAPIYVGQQETRSILKAFGWPTPETVEAAVVERDAAVAKADELAGKLAKAASRIAALELVLYPTETTAGDE
jgi:hypothetical protein